MTLCVSHILCGRFQDRKAFSVLENRVYHAIKEVQNYLQQLDLPQLLLHEFRHQRLWLQAMTKSCAIPLLEHSVL